MLDTSKAGKDGFIKAQSVVINGQVYENVGVKYKGNSTYSPSNVKNPLHIELDTYTDQNYEGITDIKLSNGAKDPSFVREVLSYSILRQYMEASLANYAQVYINGTYMGLYVNAESVSKKFVRNHFNSKNYPFFSCSPVSGASPGIRKLPNLKYLGADSTLYFPSYEIKSDYGWKDLINLCYTLSNRINEIDDILDVDRALWMLAFDNVLVNLDSYIGEFAQNYYLCKDRTGRFNSILWDFNESFGTFQSTGSGTLSSTEMKIRMTHLLHESDAGWPLISKLLSVPEYKKIYLAHMRTILNENFANSEYLSFAQSLQSIIEAAVHADPNKFFTEDQFRINLTDDVTSGMTAAPGISKLMQGRYQYLSSLTDFAGTQPAITSVSVSESQPELGESVIIKTVVSNASVVYLKYRYGSEGKLIKSVMYDDGLHGDANPHDNIFGVSVELKTTILQYYIYAENSRYASFSPARAEHNVYELKASSPVVGPGEIVINELMAQNNSTSTDEAGEYDDWIELHNNSGKLLSLDNLYLSDSYLNLAKWKFPDGQTIAANEYLIVWADENASQIGLHTNFKLSAAGENLILSYSDGTIIDEVVFGQQFVDLSYSRVPDATGSFIIQEPTFRADNGVVTAVKENTNAISGIQDAISYPNPFSCTSLIQYSLSEDADIKIVITGIDGAEIGCLLDTHLEPGTYFIEFNPSEFNLNPGIYLCRISNTKVFRYLKMIFVK